MTLRSLCWDPALATYQDCVTVSSEGHSSTGQQHSHMDVNQDERQSQLLMNAALYVCLVGQT